MRQYNVTGMSCAACSARVEKAVAAVEGVSSCSVNLLTNSMMVDGTATPDQIIEAVVKAGYEASLADEQKENISESTVDEDVEEKVDDKFKAKMEKIGTKYKGELNELNKYANIEFGLPANSVKTKVSHVDSRLDDIYLYMGNSVQGFVKVTRNSWHYAEVAIEIKAELRNQGYGTALLALMLEQARRKKVRLSYVAESDNFPSIAIAEHCGLSRIAAISFSQKHMGN